MIEALEVRDYKSHVDTRVEFSRLTVIAGPNGSGKTTFLDVLDSLNQTIHHATSGIVTARTNTTRASAEIDSTFWIDGRRFFSRPDALGFKRNLIAEMGDDELAATIAGEELGVSRATVLDLDAQKIAAPSLTKDTDPKIAPSGAGLASVIAYWMTYKFEKRDALVEAVRKILPFIEGLRVRPAKVEGANAIGQELIIDTQGAKDLPASQMSEGTLLILGLMAVLVADEYPKLLLLDDIERGLHPGAQRQLMQWLRQLVDERDDLQIVATTHSPYVIDEMEASEVWIFNHDAQGRTHAKRLSDHPNAIEALEVLTTGEFLSAEGEDWVIEDRDVGT